MPELVSVPPTVARDERQRTRIERAVAALAAAPGETSGIHSLREGVDAFAARAVLAAAAERSIDAQYYIWHADLSGTLLLAELHRAAERGVKVRVLIDDNTTSGLDSTLAAFDSHPNIQVRLFNPFRRRRARILDYLFEFSRINRRMHNKSFTVDDAATIVGGRNVGDEYFDAGHEISFEDFDLLAFGPIVEKVASDFDEYWNSECAVPLRQLVHKPTRRELRKVQLTAEKLAAGERAERYRSAVKASPLVQDLMDGCLTLEWAPAWIVSDPPSKVLGGAASGPSVGKRFEEVLGSAKREVDIVSAYFVPTERGVEALRAVAARGVKIRILTNSLAATDVPAVHSWYANRREALLDAGIELYELKPTGAGIAGKRGARGGSSGASLHAKTFSVDRFREYVGSFNFDPRSARLNTEMGVIVESKALAGRMSEVLDRELPLVAYQVREAAGGGVEWVSRDQNGERIYTSEPEAPFKRRVAARLLSLLPIEGLL